MCQTTQLNKLIVTPLYLKVFFLSATEFKIDHNYSKKAHMAPAMITRTVMARGLIVSELFRFNKVEDRALIFVRHF